MSWRNNLCPSATELSRKYWRTVSNHSSYSAPRPTGRHPANRYFILQGTTIGVAPRAGRL